MIVKTRGQDDGVTDTTITKRKIMAPIRTTPLPTTLAAAATIGIMIMTISSVITLPSSHGFSTNFASCCSSQTRTHLRRNTVRPINGDRHGGTSQQRMLSYYLAASIDDDAVVSSSFALSAEATAASPSSSSPPPTEASIVSRTTNVTIAFPSFLELMNVPPGEFVASDPFTCGGENNSKQTAPLFRVKLYPRGTNGGVGTSFSGFEMAYKVLSPLSQQSSKDERVAMYLQYLGEKEGDFVDATFALTLKGRQKPDEDGGFPSRRFDVEWRAGMRFVPLRESKLQQGRANDFGAHLMQTSLLRQFMGISDDDQLDDDARTPLTAQVEVTIHDTKMEQQHGQPIPYQKDETRSIDISGPTAGVNGRSSLLSALVKDIRLSDERNADVHNTENVRVGKVVVPILSRLSERPRLFEVGAYPGVEYRILRILKNGQERFTSCPGADYELKPIYPLVSQLERPWPVTVNEREIPRLYTPSMYNIISAVGSLLTAITGLATAFLLSQAISLFFIPSKSMDPTLQVGDVLLVDKVSPRLFRKQKIDDIVLFSPPSRLQEIVVKNGGKLSSRDLFVKRIAASPGDSVTVNLDGSATVNGLYVMEGKRDRCEAEPLRLIEKYIQPVKERVIEKGEVFVMGDCSSVSVDSRVWGPLGSDGIVGKPILRLWPLERFGPVQ